MEAIEIKLSDVIRFIKRYFLVFFVVGVLSIVGGYLSSYLFTEEYQSTAMILPEYSQSASSALSFGDLAGLAGLMGRNRTDAIRPDLYPEVLSSYPFLVKLSSKEFQTQRGEKTTLLDLLSVEDDSLKPFTAEQVEGSIPVLAFSKSQFNLLQAISGRVTASFGKLTGIITIRAELPDPRVAAEVVDFCIAYLQTFVDDYRVVKASEKVEQMEELLATSKKDYYNAELNLSAYRDRNQNIFGNMNRVEEHRLETEYLRTRNLYLDLAQKFEVAKLQRDENMPVLKVLNPPVVPLATSKPRRLIMAAWSGIFFCFITLVYVLFFKERIQDRYRKID